VEVLLNARWSTLVISALVVLKLRNAGNLKLHTSEENFPKGILMIKEVVSF
jgi:hypothetical protein